VQCSHYVRAVMSRDSLAKALRRAFGTPGNSSFSDPAAMVVTIGARSLQPCFDYRIVTIRIPQEDSGQRAPECRGKVPGGVPSERESMFEGLSYKSDRG
jgi:hypothetical protein